ncbi:XylR N-terminal domain-containing protein, partial [Oryzibacter oryziterrae]|uniref:XylR N-terminal domain-containing protein n=1 Tax=Oryzibacter oryziterrae TaxID=2766474 RepID=UPI001F391758
MVGERRVSLREVSKARQPEASVAPAAMRVRPPAPTLEDLTECLHFALGDGRIWLNNKRMVLMQTHVLGRLRAEVIGALGEAGARALFTRVGYEQGRSDAATIRERWADQDMADLFAAGPRIHTLEGFVKVTTLKIDFDMGAATYDGEFLWHDSSEADEHLAAFGLATDPACWMQTAYASGYVSELLGAAVVFRETECRATGAPLCRCTGRHAAAWGDARAEEIVPPGPVRPRFAATAGVTLIAPETVFFSHDTVLGRDV